MVAVVLTTSNNLNASEEWEMSQQNSEAISNQEDVGSGNVQQFLTFLLNDEIYGIGILSIREIIEYGNLTVVPMMPDFISGVINLRGNVVPVVNLARRFDHHTSEIGKRTSIIIIDIKDSDEESVEIGIVVDIVNEVIELDDSSIAAPPAFGANIRADFIKGMGKVDDQLMILLDVDQVLAINELSEIGELTGKRPRLAEKAGDSPEKMVSDIARTEELVPEITASTEEQAGDPGQITGAMQALDQVTQQNVVAPEELAANLLETRDQSQSSLETNSSLQLSDLESTSQPTGTSSAPNGSAGMTETESQREPQLAELTSINIKKAIPDVAREYIFSKKQDVSSDQPVPTTDTNNAWLKRLSLLERHIRLIKYTAWVAAITIVVYAYVSLNT